MRVLDVAADAIILHGAMQKRTELAGLLAVARELRPSVVYEIGTASGGTMWALARALRDEPPLFVSIDLPGGPFSGGVTVEPAALRALLEDAADAPPRLVVLHGSSLEVDLPAERPDLVVIDGDHSAAGVRADWERYGPLVAAGGAAAFHDILPHPEATGVEVELVWDEVAAAEPLTLEIVDCTDVGPAGNLWGGVGVVFL
jgi:predicted O-methyltransferase YrrM